MAENGPNTVTTSADRLAWILDLVQSDTLALFNATEDPPAEFVLLDFCHILDDAARAVKRRYDEFLEVNGE